MKILALESSAAAASVCLCEDEFLVAQSYENSGLTHSRTLLPMAEELLKNCGVKLAEVDVIAVAAGPGSFTGLRIGVSAAKGLEAMAWNVSALPGFLCPVMDARRSQVYNALFFSDGERVRRLTPDRAIGLDELAAELKAAEQTQILVGDGAGLCYNELTKRGLALRQVPPNLRFQSAWGVARAGLELARAGTLISAAELTPNYHRLSQAERERLEQENKKGND